MVYKKRCKKETSPFLSNFCWCHCSIYDVIASLLLNKASKIELVVSYKPFLIKHTECINIAIVNVACWLRAY